MSQEQAAGLLRDTTSQLILEIRKTVDFHRATAPIETLSRVVLSGGACQVEGLVDLLDRSLARRSSLRSVPPRHASEGLGRGGRRRSGLCGRGGSGDAAGGRPMIRVNLLTAGRSGNRAALLSPHQSAVAGVLMLLVTVTGVGVWWWQLGRQAAAHRRPDRPERERSRPPEAGRETGRSRDRAQSGIVREARAHRAVAIRAAWAGQSAGDGEPQPDRRTVAH